MKRVLAIGTGVVVAAIVGILIWLNFLRADGPEEFDLTENITESVSPAENSEPGSAENLDGTWTVASGSEAGYRVVEDLRTVKDFEAVGRSEQVTGSITIDGTVVTEASFEIDVASITTDNTHRDDHFSGPDVMNAAEFPTATLTLTEPADFDAAPKPGEAVTAKAIGELTLRDTTQPVEFDVQAQVLDRQIELVASVQVVFADYGIDNPSNAVATVRDEGTVEAKLLLERSVDS